MRTLLILLLLAISNTVCGQRTFIYNKQINNYWGEWKNSNSHVLDGEYSNFIIYSSGDHPSKYIMKVKILDMNIDTDKKVMKERIKSNSWYLFNGIVEYFTYKDSHSFKDIIDSWPFVPNAQSGSSLESHKVPAVIKVAPFKNKPKVYNIHIENLGIGVQLD